MAAQLQQLVSKFNVGTQDGGSHHGRNQGTHRQTWGTQHFAQAPTHAVAGD